MAFALPLASKVLATEAVGCAIPAVNISISRLSGWAGGEVAGRDAVEDGVDRLQYRLFDLVGYDVATLLVGLREPVVCTNGWSFWECSVSCTAIDV